MAAYSLIAKHAAAGLAISAGLILSACVTTPKGPVASAFSATAQSGVRVALSGHVDVNRRCRSVGTPKVRIVQEPANGTTSISKGSLRASAPGCNGKRVGGLIVFYQSNAGFKGQDQVKVEQILKDKIEEVTITINVK